MSEIKLVKNQPPGLNPGIYIGLNSEVYHNDAALSHSGIKKLDIPGRYWINSPLNPNYDSDAKKSKAMSYGHMLHLRLLEEEEFFKRFYVSPGAGYDPNKQLITRNDEKKMMAKINVLKSIDEFALFYSNAIMEVSIIWIDEETGIRMKARHDIFKPNYSVDYKKIRSMEDKTIRYSITDYGYDIQDALYTESRRAARKMLKEKTGKVYGGGERELDILREFVASDTDVFVFVFQEDNEPYYVEPLYLADDTVQEGEDKVLRGKRRYKMNIETYGTREWPRSRGGIVEFSARFGRSMDNGEY